MPNIYLIFEYSSIYLFAQYWIADRSSRVKLTPECHPISHFPRLSDIWQGISIAISRKFSIFLGRNVSLAKSSLRHCVQKYGKEQRNGATAGKIYKKSLKNKLLVLRFWRCWHPMAAFPSSPLHLFFRLPRTPRQFAFLV